MTSATEFQAKTNKAVVNMDRLDAILNGAADATVETDNGAVPTIAGVLGQYGDATEAADTAVAAAADATEAANTAVAAADGLSFQAGDNLMPQAAFSAQRFAGAAEIRSAWGVSGLSIPVGQAGTNSLIQLSAELPPATAGTIRMVVQVQVSSNFDRSPFVLVMVTTDSAGTTTGDGNYVIVSQARVGNVVTFVVDAEVLTTDRFLRPYIQIQDSDNVTGSPQTLEVTGLWWRARASGGFGPSEINVAERISSKIGKATPAGDIEALRAANAQPFNGGEILRRDDGVPIGFRVPVGVSAYETLIQPVLPLLHDATLAGSRVRVTVVGATSSSFNRVLTRYVSAGKDDGTSEGISVSELRFSRFGNAVYWTFEYNQTADDESVQPVIQVLGTGDDFVTVTPQTLEIAFTSIEYVTCADPLRKPAELNLQLARQRDLAEAADIAARGVTRTDVSVGTGGTYATPQAATAAIRDASNFKPYDLRVRAGLISGLPGTWLMKSNINVVGVGDRSRLHFENPNNAPASPDLLQSYAFTQVATSRIEGLRASVRNARYVVHVDDNNGASKNAVIEMHNARFEHLGNAEADNAAFAERAVAIGMGLSSGQRLHISAVEAIGPDGGGLSFHNNKDSEKPGHVTFINSRDVAHIAGRYASVQSQGSGQADSATYIGCVLPNGRFVSSVNWRSIEPTNQPANRCEINVVGHANSPAACYVKDPGLAFRIRSASTSAGSKVEIVAGGSAVSALFGPQVLTKRGGAGLAAACYGVDDRSGITVGGAYQTLSLGRALGDCSGTPKSFGVKFQGGSTQTVTFTTNLTAASNADVLAIINTQLGSNGTADMWAVGQETFRPLFTDEEASMRNATATAIKRGTVLAYDGARSKVRPMTSSDALSLFAGVAYEDILAGEGGRVKTRGYIALDDLWVKSGEVASLGSDLAFGESFGIDPTQAGRLIQNNGGLLQVVEPTDATEELSTAHLVAA